MHVKEPQVVRISGVPRNGVPHNQRVVLARQTPSFNLFNHSKKKEKKSYHVPFTIFPSVMKAVMCAPNANARTQHKGQTCMPSSSSCVVFFSSSRPLTDSLHPLPFNICHTCLYSRRASERIGFNNYIHVKVKAPALFTARECAVDTFCARLCSATTSSDSLLILTSFLRQISWQKNFQLLKERNAA